MAEQETMQAIIEKILSLSPAIRYVAIYHGDDLVSAQRPDLPNASSSESDKYEELIVNPALLTLVRQRGNIDCGGAQFVIIRYGSFYEIVHPIRDGHVSIGSELASNPLEQVEAIREVLTAESLL